MTRANLILCLTLLLAAPWLATAQRGRHPSQRLARELNLTLEQQRQIDPLLSEQRLQLQSIRNDASLTRQQKRSRAREVRQNTDARVDQILTSEQRAKRDQLRAQNRQHKRGQRRKNQF